MDAPVNLDYERRKSQPVSNTNSSWVEGVKQVSQWVPRSEHSGSTLNRGTKPNRRAHPQKWKKCERGQLPTRSGI
uniref:Uncharacterized protein n=1 Tax=Cucumis melo TaxID=3656 RepID=A0A9I9CUH0_CUCME